MLYHLAVPLTQLGCRGCWSAWSQRQCPPSWPGCLHLTRLVLSMAQIGRIMQQFELELGAILVDAGDAGTSAPPVHVDMDLYICSAW